jgi:DNA-binding NtrC family response regulator
MKLDEIKKEAVVKALLMHRGNRTYAARYLGICVRTIRNIMKKHKIDIPSSYSSLPKKQL